MTTRKLEPASSRGYKATGPHSAIFTQLHRYAGKQDEPPDLRRRLQSRILELFWYIAESVFVAEYRTKDNRKEVDPNDLHVFPDREALFDSLVPTVPYFEIGLGIISYNPIELLSYPPPHRIDIVDSPCIDWPAILLGFPDETRAARCPQNLMKHVESYVWNSEKFVGAVQRPADVCNRKTREVFVTERKKLGLCELSAL